MNEMWQIVKAAKIPTTRINHWVYLPTLLPNLPTLSIQRKRTLRLMAFSGVFFSLFSFYVP
jgi:hypothetical protein